MYSSVHYRVVNSQWLKVNSLKLVRSRSKCGKLGVKILVVVMVVTTVRMGVNDHPLISETITCNNLYILKISSLPELKSILGHLNQGTYMYSKHEIEFGSGLRDVKLSVLFCHWSYFTPIVRFGQTRALFVIILHQDFQICCLLFQPNGQSLHKLVCTHVLHGYTSERHLVDRTQIQNSTSVSW